MLLGYLGFVAELGVKKPLIVALGMTFACLVAVNGGLLIFRPDLFLKVYDRLSLGDYVGKSGEWRKDVHNTEYKILGIILLLSGLLFLGLLAKVFLGPGTNS
jgi:hypothetical protein